MEEQKNANTEPLSAKKKWLLSVSGLFVGFLNGFFGGGGGMLTVPALTMSGLEERKAHATAIAVILPLSVISAVIYLVKGGVSLAPLLSVGAGVVAGGAAGAVFLKKIDKKLLTLVFYGVMIAAGIKTVL